MSFKKIFEEIEKFEREVKRKFPSNWRVKIANAKSITDMEVGKDADPMKWNHYYLDNLRRQR